MRRWRRSKRSAMQSFRGRSGVCMATSGPGCHPSAQRPVRRQAWTTCRCVAIVGQTTALGHGRLLPTGGRPGQRCSRTSATSTVQTVSVPQQLPEPHRPGHPYGAGHPLPDLHHHALRRPRAGLGAAGSRVQDGALEPRDSLAALALATSRHRRAAEILNAGEKVAILVGRGARGARKEVLEVADLLGAGVAKALLGQRRSRRRPAVGDRCDRVAGNPTELRDDDGLRHRPDRRVRTSPTPSSCPRSTRPGRSRSTGTDPSSACAIPTR